MISRYEHLNPQTQSAVLELIAQATDHDGVPPVAEHVLLHLRHGGDKSDTHLIAQIDNQVAGYAHLDLTDEVEGPSAEIVVAPKFRNQNLGHEIVKELKVIAGEKLRLWSHGDLPGARNIAEDNGFTRSRTVIQMRRSLIDPIPELDAGLQVRSFKVGIDNAPWIEANNRAFAGHPEQSNWSARDLEIRTKEDWFDPNGFLITEIDSRIAAFSWTKIHGGHTHKHSSEEQEHDHDPIGELYIMGVDPDFQGRGLGYAMAIAGLRHIRHCGIFSAMLYVDAENGKAISLYTKLGFQEWGRDVLYRLVQN